MNYFFLMDYNADCELMDETVAMWERAGITFDPFANDLNEELGRCRALYDQR